MSTAFKKKIKSAVDAVIPPAQGYTVYLSPTGFDNTEVVRVITPTWKTLGKAERIAKVQNAVMPKLDVAEKSRIFRFSVLTPREWKAFKTISPVKNHVGPAIDSSGLLLRDDLGYWSGALL